MNNKFYQKELGFFTNLNYRLLFKNKEKNRLLKNTVVFYFIKTGKFKIQSFFLIKKNLHFNTVYIY